MNTCDLCDGLMIVSSSQLVCNKCGVTAPYYVFQQHYNQSFDSYSLKSKATIYKRIKYFMKLIKNIRGRLIPLGTINDVIMNKIKNKKFNSIHELRSLFKSESLSKYYDFIYYYWFKIKGKHLIKLSENDTKRLHNKFVAFELAFRLKYPNKRNIINYNYLIRTFLTEIGKKEYCQYLKPIILSERIDKLNKIYNKIIAITPQI